jgi:hypothetical protein
LFSFNRLKNWNNTGTGSTNVFAKRNCCVRKKAEFAEHKRDIRRPGRLVEQDPRPELIRLLGWEEAWVEWVACPILTLS